MSCLRLLQKLKQFQSKTLKHRYLFQLYVKSKKLYTKESIQCIKYMSIIWSYRQEFAKEFFIYKSWFYYKWMLWKSLEHTLLNNFRLTKKWVKWFRRIESSKIEIPEILENAYQNWKSKPYIKKEMQNSLRCKNRVLHLLERKGGLSFSR